MGPDNGFYREGMTTAADAAAADWDNERRGGDRDGDRERRERDGDRRDEGVDIRMGDNSMRMNEDDGIELRTEGFSMRMSEDDEGRGRLEIVMGATKIAATAATAIVASTLY